MTAAKPHNRDAITQAQAAEILGLLPPTSIKRLIREGRLHRVPDQFPSMCREEVEAFRDDPVEPYWVGTSETSRLLGLSTTRVSQLADTGSLPFEYKANGLRRFRRDQILVIGNARAAKWHGQPIGTD